MNASAATPEAILASALESLRTRGWEELDWLNAIPSPVYATDAEGRITFFNQACIAFSGRTPRLGQDSWCVSWKLYDLDGRALAHDACPMAVAIREKRPVRDTEAVAERPDGTRIAFRPFPTPLLDEDGNLLCAVNMLVAVTDEKQTDRLRAQAQRCRRFARSVSDEETAATFSRLAEEYEQQANRLRPN